MEYKAPHMIIKDVLGGRTPARIENRESLYRHSAVLIPLLRDCGEYKVLFTKRTHQVDDHKGQISFPGGRVDEEDRSYQETALRETWEEVGIRSEDVTLLGRMDDALTLSSNYLVHPFVGYVPYPYAYALNPREVKRLIYVPLKVFLPDSTLAKTDRVEYGGRTYESQIYRYDGEVIWGATARIMMDFIRILGEKIDLLVKNH